MVAVVTGVVAEAMAAWLVTRVTVFWPPAVLTCTVTGLPPIVKAWGGDNCQHIGYNQFHQLNKIYKFMQRKSTTTPPFGADLGLHACGGGGGGGLDGPEGGGRGDHYDLRGGLRTHAGHAAGLGDHDGLLAAHGRRAQLEGKKEVQYIITKLP